MIELRNVNKYFNKHKKNEIHVINDVSLKLDKGLVAILGASGSGKTTLLNAIGGLDKISKGEIYVNGERITKRTTYKIDKIRNLNIGYIFQDYKLVENMSVYDNVALVLKMIGIKDKKEISKRVDYILEQVGMYRYRKRPVSALSGGERQRVGIARALVKNPDIIIADEPTGNLDSKNSLEIMNIIKAISIKKLVILVTHETTLAHFYATRIIEIEDGKIVKDYENSQSGDLDYQVESKFYLKDFNNHEEIKEKNINLNYYTNEIKDLNLTIVVNNGNIYIKSDSNEKIEVIDNNSNIELIDDHYKKLSKSEYKNKNFDFEEIINNNTKKKYSSILNPFTLVINGFKKIFDYSVLKKILLGGFFMAGMFILLSISNILGLTEIKDEDFVTKNRSYLDVNITKLNVKDYLNYEKLDSINYILPGSSIVGFRFIFNDYYQTTNASQALNGSLTSLDLIKSEDILWGRMPENNYELVVDQIALDAIGAKSTFNIPKQVGILNYTDYLGRELNLNGNLDKFKIVGIVNLDSPSIYANKEMLITIISNAEVEFYEAGYGYPTNSEIDPNKLLDYNIFKDKITLTKGNLPDNDYEVIVNEKYKNLYKLNKKIDNKVNDQNLKVVGYFKGNIDALVTNSNTVKYDLITKSSDLVIVSNDKNKTIDEFHELKLNIKDSYTNSREEYKKEVRNSIISSLTVSGVILAISLIEIFLIVRSSFLSRVKEIGIFRAIGVKKSDIYRMFSGEIIAITTLVSVPGVIFMYYIIEAIKDLPFMNFKMNITITLLAIIFIYIFNLLVGLLPVFKVLRKTPAQILSRQDLD